MDVVKHDKIMKLQGMNLYVKNLDDSVSDDQLRELFGAFGTITSARVMRGEDGAASKGFGFVCYSSAEEATRAVAEMNNKVIAGKPIAVTLHQRKEVRQAQLSATFGARAAMGGGRGAGGFQQGGQPFMYGQQGGYMGGMNRGFPGGGRGGPQYMNYMQGRGMGGRPQGNFPQGGNMMGGRGGGGRGMMPNMNNNMANRGMAPGVKFNMQARNQPGVGGPMPPHMMGQMAPAGAFPAPAAAPLDEMLLAQADPSQQKNMIGERLYPLIMAQQPQLAGKITGMLLEMDNAELLHLIESPESLSNKIEEALDVLRKHSSE